MCLEPFLEAFHSSRTAQVSPLSAGIEILSCHSTQPSCPDPWSCGIFKPTFTWNSTMYFLKDKSSVLNINGFC